MKCPIQPPLKAVPPPVTLQERIPAGNRPPRVVETAETQVSVERRLAQPPGSK
jgi:hypothetical protein